MPPTTPYLFEPQSGSYQERQAAGGRNFWEPQQPAQEIPPEVAQLLMMLQQQGGA